MFFPSTITIDLGRYRRNVEILRSRLSPGTRFCAVVKANAYGHGLVPIAQAAGQAGAEALGIVDNEEATDLRQAGISLPILRLRPAIVEEVREVIDLNIEEPVGDLETVNRFSQLAQELGSTISVHLKVDVGIGRMGVSPSEAKDLLMRARSAAGIRVRGVMTHFPSSDEPHPGITIHQIDLFRWVVRSIGYMLHDNVVVHAANSEATLRFPEAHLGMVRVGLATYGLSPSKEACLPAGVETVMRWTTRIVQIRPMHEGETIGYGMTYRLDQDRIVATLPVGYADGYFRSLSGRAEVLVRGRRCPVLGRISMDLTCIDVSEAPDAAVGDEVVLLGDEIGADELASRAGTISYEVVTRIGNIARTGRSYV
ncbi:MAG: alanine racemase [bacterium]